MIGEQLKKKSFICLGKVNFQLFFFLDNEPLYLKTMIRPYLQKKNHRICNRFWNADTRHMRRDTFYSTDSSS